MGLDNINHLHVFSLGGNSWQQSCLLFMGENSTSEMYLINLVQKLIDIYTYYHWIFRKPIWLIWKFVVDEPLHITLQGFSKNGLKKDRYCIKVEFYTPLYLDGLMKASHFITLQWKASKLTRHYTALLLREHFWSWAANSEGMWTEWSQKRYIMP